MQQFYVTLESHPLFTILCGLIALGYTGLMYFRSQHWNKPQRWGLASLRFLIVFMAALLLLSPMLKQWENYYEKPVIVIVQDNSSSVSAILDSASLHKLTADVRSMKNHLEAAGYEMEHRSLVNSIDDGEEILYNAQLTDLGKALKEVSNDYESRNLASVVLITDGLYNNGIAPQYQPFPYQINTVGIGDTVPKRDLMLAELRFNKIAYQGNQFPVVAKIANNGYGNQPIHVAAYSEGKLLQEKVITPGGSSSLESVEFLIEAKSNGLRRFTVAVNEQPGEFNVENNKAEAYVDIIDGKERILMIAASPHPDIAAIRSAIQENSNYEFELFIPGIDDAPDGKFDLVIFHQLGHPKNSLDTWYEKYIREETPHWVITSTGSNYARVSEKLAFASITIMGKEGDEVAASFNESFSHFTISDEAKTLLARVPPMQVPFGKVNTGAQVFLYQKLGAVVTRNPLLLVSENNGSKAALLLATGIWKWKIFDYAQSGRHDAFNEVVLKLVQYLSTRQDKRKFKCYTVNNREAGHGRVVFTTEVYNDLYEPVYDQDIDISIINEQGNEQAFSYTTSKTNSSYTINDLEEGVYKYTASTLLHGEKSTVQGEFSVKRKNVEMLNLTADFSTLKEVSRNTGGTFYQAKDIGKLATDLAEKQAPEIIHTEERLLSLVNMPWVLLILVLLLSAEWFIRKYSGQY